MTGINADKIIQNLEVLYNLASIFPLPNLLGAVFFLLASLFFLISDLENGTKLLPYPPPLEGGGGQKSLFRLLNMGPRSQNWVPMFCRSGRWLLCLSAMNTNSRNWGPILGNPIATASIPREGCNWAIPIRAIGQLAIQSNSIQFPQFNDGAAECPIGIDLELPHFAHHSWQV